MKMQVVDAMDFHAVGAHKLNERVEDSRQSVPRLVLDRDELPTDAFPCYGAPDVDCVVYADMRKKRPVAVRTGKSAWAMPCYEVFRDMRRYYKVTSGKVSFPADKKAREALSSRIVDDIVAMENRLFAGMLRQASRHGGKMVRAKGVRECRAMSAGVAAIEIQDLKARWAVCNPRDRRIAGEAGLLGVEVMSCDKMPRGIAYLVPEPEYLGVFFQKSDDPSYWSNKVRKLVWPDGKAEGAGYLRGMYIYNCKGVVEVDYNKAPRKRDQLRDQLVESVVDSSGDEEVGRCDRR